MTRLSVWLLLSVLLLSAEADAQIRPPQAPPPPGDNIAPSAEVNSFGLYWYQTVECNMVDGECVETPSTYLFGYQQQLESSQLGCNEQCKRKAEPDEIMQIVGSKKGVRPMSASDKAQLQPLNFVSSTRANPKTLLSAGSKIKDPRLNVFFDDLELQTVIPPYGTSPEQVLYFRCQAAFYQVSTSVWLPLMIAVQVPEAEAECVDGFGYLVLNVSQMRAELRYEVDLELGRRDLPQEFIFDTIILSGP